MSKNSKRSSLSREKLLEIFQRAFDAVGIETDVAENFEKRRSVMKELVEHLADVGLPGKYAFLKEDSVSQKQEKINDYSLYLRNVLGRARAEENKTVGFDDAMMQPVIDFPKLCTTILKSSVVFSAKKYPWWNLWRMPGHGNLVRRNNTLFFENEKASVALKEIQSVNPAKMSHDKERYWLEVKLKNNAVYLADFSPHTHQLAGPDELMRLLKKI